MGYTVEKQGVAQENLEYYDLVDVEIEIDLNDIEEYIDNADKKDLNYIKDMMKLERHLELRNNLVEDMKMQVLVKAQAKYTLAELEERLGLDYL